MLGYIVTVQRDYEGTIKKGILRILGQAAGALLAYILLVCVRAMCMLAL